MTPTRSPEPKHFMAIMLGTKSEVQGIALWGNMLAQSVKKSSQPWTAPLGMELSVTGNDQVMGNVQAKTKRPPIRFIREERQAQSRWKCERGAVRCLKCSGLEPNGLKDSMKKNIQPWLPRLSITLR